MKLTAKTKAYMGGTKGQAPGDDSDWAYLEEVRRVGRVLEDGAFAYKNPRYHDEYPPMEGQEFDEWEALGTEFNTLSNNAYELNRGFYGKNRYDRQTVAESFFSLWNFFRDIEDNWGEYTNGQLWEYMQEAMKTIEAVDEWIVYTLNNVE